jgi:hypothetical protein
MGGFYVTTYTIDDQVEQGSLAGKISVDKVADALVGADFPVPERLFFPPGSNQSGDVQISLTAQQADVPAITLP